jgi:hypothetical protein
VRGQTGTTRPIGSHLCVPERKSPALARDARVDSANGPWPTNGASTLAGLPPVGQRVARSLPEGWPAVCREGKALH